MDSIFTHFEPVQEQIKVIAIDGKYRGYPSNSKLSDDGSRGIVKSFAKAYGKSKVQLYDYPNLLETQKRQKYVDIAAKQAIPFVLILDSDEYVECPKPFALIKELECIEKQWLDSSDYSNNKKDVSNKSKPSVGNVVNVKFVETDPITGSAVSVAYKPRLWYRPEDMYYTTKHYWFKSKRATIHNNNKKGSYEDGGEFRTLSLSDNLRIWHDKHSCRTEERQQESRYYQIEKLPMLEE